MATQRAEVDDIIYVDHLGRQFYSQVTEVRQAGKGASIEYKATPITKGITWYEVPSNEVKAVYRKLGRRRGGGE